MRCCEYKILIFYQTKKWSTFAPTDMARACRECNAHVRPDVDGPIRRCGQAQALLC